jgi:hypothetical protein
MGWTTAIPERFPLTGTIEEIGKDIKRIKEMGHRAHHIYICGFGVG